MTATLSVFTLGKTDFSNKPFFIVIFLFHVICFFMIVINYVRFLIENRRNARVLGQNMRFVVETEKKMN